MTFPVLSAGTSAYNLTKSLRFRASASAYLTRTPASASNRKTWTWSAWVKLGSLSTGRTLFGVAVDANNRMHFDINSSDQLQLTTRTAGTVEGNLFTNAVFRDPSAWYHIVCVWDSTKTTVAAGISIAVNGVQQTLSTSVSVVTNVDGWINSANATDIGRLGALGNYFDGYMAEVNFIDGQALTPSSFGSTNAVTGVWQPAKYAGTYGTNGFYLPFTNATSTTTLGNDFSGNGNNWTTNNISLTSGATYDSMTDVPTLTSSTTANFAVLNPLSIYVVNPTDGNLAFSGTSAGGIGSMGASSGKYYWETVYTAIGSGDGVLVGVRSAESIATGAAENVGYYGGGTENGKKTINSGAATAYGATWTTGDVIGVALDITGGLITFYKNNVSQGAISYTFTGKSWVSFNWRTGSAGTNTGSINFGQRPFAYTPPSGFVALNTFNLPSSTIPAGNKFMDATTYTGTGSSLSVTNSGSMQPDLAWIKSRSAATDHALYDVLRGTQARLESNTTDAEVTSDNGVTAFGTGGFTVGTLAQVNTSAATYVGWQWKGGGAGVTNTAGTVTSTVSANTTSGFSVVTYTGTGSAATVGHGLNVAPAMIIAKSRDNAGGDSGIWVVYHKNLSAPSFFLYLNQTNAETFATTVWNNTAPTSTVFSIGTASGSGTASTHVAYCFAPIAGFSAFGSYAGNGSSDGPFIYTGFRPRWIMCKSSTDIGGWTIMDTSRVGYNANNSTLYAEATTVEQGYLPVDILSNGFKIRRIDTGTSFNSSGQTYIYAAFAENPFKNALAR